MKNKLKCILLVDDNYDDNYFHQIVIKGMNITDTIQVVNNGIQALEFLKNENQIIPELVFLDINMPKMNGWEFLEAYRELNLEQKAKVIIIMLTTSEDPADKERAGQLKEVIDFKVKPLTKKMLTEIVEQYFPNHKN